MDYARINVIQHDSGPKKGLFELTSDFIVGRSKDLMVRGASFYAVWDEELNLWSTDEYDIQRIVDKALAKKSDELGEQPHKVKYLSSYSTNAWSQFRSFLKNVSDNSHVLDQKLTFANTEVKKSDYVSHRLPYNLEPGDYSAWDELVGSLYSVEERAKIEWAIGSIVSGDSKKIQKFMVFYGPGGTGKSTILNIINDLFAGYTTTFEAKALGSNNGSFATEAFKNNPLVAIQQDGDLSKIEDNTRLNSIISHEYMTMNEKYKASYTAKVNAFLFMGTNQPVKISDAKSGIIRRLIDVHPTGVRIPPNHYNALLDRVQFELGAIASHCLDVYRQMGKNYYNTYRPLEMMFQTDIFFNYIESVYDVFKSQEGMTLKQAYSLYKEFCNETGVERMLPQYKVREELRNYFDHFQESAMVDGVKVRSYYTGFNANKFKAPTKEVNTFSLVMDETKSIFDEMGKDWPAQLATGVSETPGKKWDNVTETLKNIDTSQTHYVMVPEDHIIIDFDLKDETGEKSLERNLAAASVWPATYAELSKSGKGVHLHYIYTKGDVSELSQDYSEGIEIKTLPGHSSLRRRLTRCNNIAVAEMNGGLPLKENKVLDSQVMQGERTIRALITRNLRKEIHPGTKPSIDFIKKILDDAVADEMSFDVTDMRSRVVAFANNSSNQQMQCLKVVQQMQFSHNVAKENSVAEPEAGQVKAPDDQKIAFYDVEVYPNLFIICWKYIDSDQIVRMVNPTQAQVEEFMKLKLVGFNNRRYDNHIIYARHLGFTNEQLFKLSSSIVANDRSGMFGEAYNLSYADIYDFSSKKQGLKKFQIELGLKHQEMDLPWDKPVDESLWDKVVEYCVNDVLSTEATFQSRKQDFVARQILADLSGLTPNDTTAKHTAKILFGNDRTPQSKFVYTDLSKDFPGYIYDHGKSTYRGENPSEGGYVYAEPGIYENVAVLDIASMHPTSIEQLDLFGPYTKNFSALKSARVAIKHKDYDSAKQMLDGKLAPYLSNTRDAKALSDALKIVINIVYGLTSAKFDNPFRHNRNKDNIVAKRGALFMIDLKHICQEKGLQVVHIKTDSIKIPNATPEDIAEVMEYGKKYGYDFEHEATYDKFCLVNDAVYIARYGWAADEEEHPVGSWDAVGAQFQHPYVYKTMFSQEKYDVNDLTETKSVSQGSMYLDMDLENQGWRFVGRTGRFVPVKEGGGTLYRVKDEKSYAVTGTKGYFWLEQEMAEARGNNVNIDMNYFENLSDKARKAIEKYGDFDEFIA